MSSALSPAVVPLHCSYPTFKNAWDRTHCVILRRPRSDRRTRSAAALPELGPPLLSTLRKNAALLEETYTAEGQGADTAASSRKRKKGGSSSSSSSNSGAPPTAAALFSGASLPCGRYYSSFVIARKPMLISSILENTHGLAPPCFDAGCVREETALWFFIGCNDGSGEYLSGRPAHTDAVKHDGTYHRQLAGRKEWTLRPTEELVRRLRKVHDASVEAEKGEASGSEGEGEGEEEGEPSSCVITCEAGDVLVVSTREWWHCTRLPSGRSSAGDDNSGEGGGGGLSVSVAREINFSALGQATGADDVAGDDVSGDDDGATSFVNIDGLFATRSIAAGSVVLTEDEAAAGLEV